MKSRMLCYILLSVFALLLLTACGGNDLDQLKKDKFCSECDLSGADLTGVNLRGAELTEANLDGVIGADFTGAFNVPPKYLED